MSSWVNLPLSLDYEVGHCFDQVLSPFAFFTGIGTFYLALITSFAVFSVMFFISDTHTTCSDPELDGSTISHIINAWSKDIFPSSLQYWDRWALRYANMEQVVVEYVWPLSYWIPWEPLFPPIAYLCWVYSWIYRFAYSAISGYILLGQIM